MNTDRLTVRMIAGGLLLIALVVVTGGMWLADHGRTIPDALIALGGTALGGAGSFLVASSTGRDPTPVQVINAPGDPVPVDPT